MARITGSDQILLLLRERLTRANRSGRPAKTARNSAAQARPLDRPLDRLRGAAALDGLSDDDRRRAIVHALLVEDLGDAVTNDPQFRDILDDVLRIITTTPGGPTLIDQAAAALKAG
ncbi:MAG TPA: hypothetical protein VFQ57_02290 [Sphingomonas sp.]|jgi:hypothetical protein|nr:hypothetical protein [Sphingomonas sp.]